MMAMRLKLFITQWFVEPVDKYTNDAIAGYLADQPSAGDAAIAGLEDTEGNRHDVWQVAHSTITRLEASKNTMPLAFRVYFRHGPRGPIKLWKFPHRKRPKLTRASELESPKKPL
jgi:hypothetical protein